MSDTRPWGGQVSDICFERVRTSIKQVNFTLLCLREFLEELIIARYEPLSILLDTLVSDRLGPYTLCMRAMNGMIDRVYDAVVRVVAEEIRPVDLV
jgi:hypothetical protein